MDTNVPIEDSLKNIFSIELEESSNKLKQENENLVINRINSLTLLELSKLKKDTYLNNILLEIENKFEVETNSRYYGMKKMIEIQYK